MHQATRYQGNTNYDIFIGDVHPKLETSEIPANYFGPKYDFRGTQQAIYAATYLYKNSLEVGAKIVDSGTESASSTARKTNPMLIQKTFLEKQDCSPGSYSKLRENTVGGLARR